MSSSYLILTKVLTLYLYGVIEYLPDPVRAYREIRRVLKDDGVLGSRHSDWGAFMFAPRSYEYERFFELFRKYMRHCGGDPEFGRYQLESIDAAGFKRLSASASCDCWTPDAPTTRFVADFMATYCVSPEFSEPMIQLGMATEFELQTVAAALQEWAKHPAAFAAEPWGEAVAWR